MAMAAPTIVAEHLTLTGSIGVVLGEAIVGAWGASCRACWGSVKGMPEGRAEMHGVCPESEAVSSFSAHFFPLPFLQPGCNLGNLYSA